VEPFFAVHAYINVAAVQVEYCLSRLRIVAENCISTFVYAFVLITLLSLTSASGTSIIAFLINGKVAVATDSKERIEIKGKNTYQSICKLHAGNRFAWAAYGLVAEVGGWDVRESIDTIAKTNKSSVAKIAELDKMIPRYIHHAVENVQKFNPKEVLSFANGREVFAALYIGLDNGKVTVSSRDYVIDLVKGQINVESKWTKDCPSSSCFTTQMFIIGSEAAAQRYITKDPKVRWPQSIEEAIETAVKIVNLESEDVPDYVGSPINTAIIDATGIHWGINNATCPNTDEPIKPTAKLAKPKR